MALVVNTNVASLNAQRSLSTTNMQLQQSFEKLSSGLRIVRAGDDAAGLAISERMRATIRSLDQASRNTSDGVSLVQTAEGAYNEVHGILTRMRELGVQSANGTLATTDRANLNTEFQNLSQEITRIAESTNFNGTALLSASSTIRLQIGSGTTAGTDTLDVNLVGSTATSLGLANAPEREVSSNFASATTALGGTDGNVQFTVGATTYQVNLLATDTVQDAVGKVNGAAIPGISASVQSNADGTVAMVFTGTSAFTDNKDAATFTNIAGGAAVDVLSAANATTAIGLVDAAINTVSSNRANLGAIQNRLESAQRNTENRMENLVAAESRIRDVDVAKETARLTRNQILQQAGVSILSQANQSPQAALSLLRG